MLPEGAIMDIQEIVSALREERDRLEQAIAALEGEDGRRRGHRAELPEDGRRARRGRRRLSAAAKKRISDMMKKRWAERKKAAKIA
jgi:hypothetical protein